MFNNRGPRMDPWGIPFTIVFHKIKGFQLLLKISKLDNRVIRSGKLFHDASPAYFWYNMSPKLPQFSIGARMLLPSIWLNVILWSIVIQENKTKDDDDQILWQITTSGFLKNWTNQTWQVVLWQYATSQGTGYFFWKVQAFLQPRSQDVFIRLGTVKRWSVQSSFRQRV